MAARTGPAKGMNSSSAREQAERERRMHAERPEAEANEQSDGDHRNELAPEPQAQGIFGFIHRFGEQGALGRGYQLDRADGVRTRLGGEEHAGRQDHQDIRQAGAERQDETAERGHARLRPHAFRQLTQLLAEPDVPDASFERMPCGRQGVAQGFDLPEDGGSEGGGQQSGRAEDADDRKRDRKPFGKTGQPGDAVGERPKDRGHDDGAEQHQDQGTQKPGKQEQGHQPEDDQHPACELLLGAWRRSFLPSLRLPASSR